MPKPAFSNNPRTLMWRAALRPCLRNISGTAYAVLLLSALPAALAQVPASPSQGKTRPPGRYSLEQAVSDRAQLHTIAIDGLAFLTGTFCYDTFLPPGKVSDYFGFQYLRDIDAAAGGHNTGFLTRIANNILNILNDQQKALLLELGQRQVSRQREIALRRYPLMLAFRRNLEGRAPAGSSGLDLATIQQYSAGIFELGAELAYERAEIAGRIANSLSPEQKAALAKLKFGDSRTWPESPEGFDKRKVPHDVHVAIMTYASEFFSWYAGSLEADTYFCPEGHGTYFGAFFLKDAPAMHQKNYSISMTMTGDGGADFLELLDPTQRELIVKLVTRQRPALQGIVTSRRAIATELRQFLAGRTPERAKVLALARHYGECDGELSYLYATHFAEVNTTLTPDQRSALAQLRGPGKFPSQGAYLYSQAVPAPDLPASDFLFSAPRR